jgi:voltage-gated potassium channel
MGQFISMIVMLLGYSIIAVPTGIVVGETINEYKHKRANENPNEDFIPEEFDEYEDSTVQRTESGGEVAPRFCTHCGHAESDPDARFCRYCGTLLSKSQPKGWINDFFTGE